MLVKTTKLFKLLQNYNLKETAINLINIFTNTLYGHTET